MPAIIVLFAIPPTDSPHMAAPNVALAAGLLVIGMLGSLLGAFALAAIGAERDPTANLAAATMFAAIPVVLSVVSILAAFAVLAAHYVPESSTLFVLIAGVGGLFGVGFTAFSIGDSPSLGPVDDAARAKWATTQWLQSREKAYVSAYIVAGFGIVPIVVGMVVRLTADRLSVSVTVVNWIVGFGVVLAVTGTLFSVLKTAHPLDGVQRGLRPFEAFSSILAISLYTLVLMIWLP